MHRHQQKTKRQKVSFRLQFNLLPHISVVTIKSSTVRKFILTRIRFCSDANVPCYNNVSISYLRFENDNFILVEQNYTSSQDVVKEQLRLRLMQIVKLLEFE